MHPAIASRVLPLRGPIPRLPFLGHLLALQADPLRFLDRLAEQHAEIASIGMGPLRGHVVISPDLVGEVLREKGERYGRGTRVYKAMTGFLGYGILTSEGEHWRKHRRIVQPGFHPRRLQAFAETMTRVTSEGVDGWGDEIELREAMMRITLGIVGETLFGTQTGAIAEDVGRAVDAAQRYAEKVIGSIVVEPDFVPTRRNRDFQRHVARLDVLLYDLIDARMRSSARGDDVLSMLVDARDEDGKPISRKQIRDEVATLLAAGHETTANALVWTFYRLSRHPEAGRKLRRELDEVLGGRVPTFADVPQLVQTARVLDESMRLHPPVWLTGRMAMEDHALGGHPIRKGDLLLISPWINHRHPRFWTDPEGFDPDRWAELEKGARHPFQYYPFGGGPRKCVGAGFARMEGILALATIAQRVQLELVPGQRVEALPQITLGVRDPLRMAVRKRSVTGVHGSVARTSRSPA